MNASKVATATQRINPFYYHRVHRYIFDGQVDTFSAEMKLGFQYIAFLQNKHHKVFLNYAAIDDACGLGYRLFDGSQLMIEKFLRMGIMSRHEYKGRHHYLVHELMLEEV